MEESNNKGQTSNFFLLKRFIAFIYLMCVAKFLVPPRNGLADVYEMDQLRMIVLCFYFMYHYLIVSVHVIVWGVENSYTYRLMHTFLEYILWKQAVP